MKYFAPAILLVALVGCDMEKYAKPDKPKKTAPTTKVQPVVESPKDQTPAWVDFHIKQWKDRNLHHLKAGDVLADYAENTIAAGKDYGGKYFAVTGAVMRVDKSWGGRPFVLLYDGRQYSITSIRCNLADPDGVEDLRAGDVIHIWGKIVSGGNLGVTMNDARIVTARFNSAVQKRRDELASK